MSSFWCAARIAPKRAALATQCLGLAGYRIYLPKIREYRTLRGRRVEASPPLFPGYLFIAVVSRWYDAKWCPGVANLIMAGDGPARVPDSVISEIRSRERNGLVELAKPRGFQQGDRVRIVSGPLANHLGLFDGQAPRERVAILLRVLGSQTRVELPADAIEPIEATL
jgi:transcriptional antiterminator RfaH